MNDDDFILIKDIVVFLDDEEIETRCEGVRDSYRLTSSENRPVNFLT